MDLDKKDRKRPWSDIVGSILVGSVLFVPLILLEGYILSKMWLWFIVPVFSLPVLTVGQAVGICCMLTLFPHTIHGANADESLTAHIIDKNLTLVFVLLELWGVSYIIHCILT